MRKIGKIFGVMIIMFYCCASITFASSRELHVNPMTALAKVVAKGSVTYQCKRLRFDVAEPAMDIYNSFIAEYGSQIKEQKGDHYEVAKMFSQRARNDIDKLRALKVKITNVDVIKMNDEFVYYLSRFIECAIMRIECVTRQATEENYEKREKIFLQGQSLQEKEVYEAKYGYENAVSVIFSNGVKAYNITQATAAAISQGNTYTQIMHLFKMPGIFLPQLIGYVQNKAIVYQPVIWHDNEKLVYVVFVDDKAVTWKVVRANNGFLNKS